MSGWLELLDASGTIVQLTLHGIRIFKSFCPTEPPRRKVECRTFGDRKQLIHRSSRCIRLGRINAGAEISSIVDSFIHNNLLGDYLVDVPQEC
jgi:hypothetical protein